MLENTVQYNTENFYRTSYSNLGVANFNMALQAKKPET